MKLLVSDIKEDATLQLREGGLDMDRVKAMEEFVEQGGVLPPITVFGDDNLLGDGHHRLYVAMDTGALDIEANRLPGGQAEAIAAAIFSNDSAVSKPLNRTERNKGVKLLLKAGWTQRQIAKATGIHQTTVMDIHQALAMRGELPKTTAAEGGRDRKPVAVLPKEVSTKLKDTMLTRIADVPKDKQVETATAIAATGISEPRAREAIKAINKGADPTAAVNAVASKAVAMKADPTTVARMAAQRLEAFLASDMTIDGKPHDFWQVLDVLATITDSTSQLTVNRLAGALAEASVKLDVYATKFSSKKLSA